MTRTDWDKRAGNKGYGVRQPPGAHVDWHQRAVIAEAALEAARRRIQTLESRLSSVPPSVDDLIESLRSGTQEEKLDICMKAGILDKFCRVTALEG